MVEEKKLVKNKKRKAVVKASIKAPATLVEEKKPGETKGIIEKTLRPVVTKKYTWRLKMLILAGGLMAAAVMLFVIYMATQNMVAGAPAVFMGFAGAILFKYYWSKSEENLVTEQMGPRLQDQVNCMNIYPDRVVFENWPANGNGEKPTGYPQECLNDHKKYWVNILDEETQVLIPFMLPDQQYYDPGVFAERVLELPAHRRIFRRKEKLGQHIKTALLVVVIIILWILILTTSGA